MTALAVTLAMAADLLTANPASEFNPLGKALLLSGYAFPAKVALAAFVLAAVTLIQRWRPGPLAGLVAAVAVVAGVGGMLSNLG